MKVIRMVTTHGSKPVREGYKMEMLYKAAASVFALPSYEQVLFFRDGGTEPEMPPCVVGTPGGLYAIGRMISANGAPSIRIITDGGREIVVEQNQVTVNFRTGLRNASTEAAREVLMHLYQHTFDEICLIELEDGRFISDTDIAPGRGGFPGRRRFIMAKYKKAKSQGAYIDRLRTMYPFRIIAHGGYEAVLCGVQPLLEGQQSPIYRFPGGPCVVDVNEIEKIVEW